ncbi:MAG: DUF962 domain-containing protein [Kangiellaceae bacterium]|nr:DUF962 domain-containing protein [Kangiellaceae bacterium]
MPASQFQTFQDFWPYYLSEHRLGVSRLLHYFGTISSMLLLGYLISQAAWSWLWLILPVGYGPAWIGHFFFEKNKPATFKHPLWSLMGDYKMLFLAATGQMSKELDKLD